ncbi:MAG: PQQ-binding-like beta-propeller repeat protein [Limisphaerales bacterium]
MPPKPHYHYSFKMRLLISLSAWLIAWTAPAADWPQWRGPTRDGQVVGLAWPDSLKPDRLKQVWRTELGASYSGPLSDAERVYTTESRDQTHEAVLAFDRATGRQLWRVQWEGYQKVPFFARGNGDWIRATPALADGRLFVGGMRDVLVCLDAATGREAWRVDFPGQFQKPPPEFGFVSSPLVASNAVFVQAGAGFVKVEAATGKVLWTALADDGGMWGSAFSSPVLATLGGTPQLVVQTRSDLAGVAADTGRVLWHQPIKAFRGMNILTPTVTGPDTLFTSAYGGETKGWRAARDGDAWQLAEAWTLKLEGYMTSPVLVDGHAYLHLRNQRVACVDVAAGRLKWESDEKFGKYWSLVANGRRLLALDERGELLLLAANPEKFELVDRRKVTEADTWAHLGVSGPDLLVREREGLAVWRWQ